MRRLKAKYPLLESAVMDYIKEERKRRNCIAGKIRFIVCVMYI